jgi:hypothetical protein
MSISESTSPQKDTKYEFIPLDSQGIDACSDFRKLRSEGEKSFELNFINLGANAAHSSNEKLQNSGKVIAQYIACDRSLNISDCKNISKIEMLRALADIETVCKSHQ